VFFLFRIPLGALFFVPGLISARRNQDSFERSGDGRVKSALAAVHTASCAAYIGIIGVLVMTFLSWAVFK